MTHQEIADLVTNETGYPVSRSTVSTALHRAGEAQPAKKHADEIPWRVKQQHQTHYAARMLRVLGRRRKGEELSEETNARLDAWLAQLDDHGAVVVYVPTSDDGFFYVSGDPDVPGIPVMKEVALKV